MTARMTLRSPLIILALSLLLTPAAPAQLPAPPNLQPQEPQEEVVEQPPPTMPRPAPAPPQPLTPEPTWRQLVGFDAALARLGRNLPVGRGIQVGYVEGGGNAYAPNANHPRLAGVQVVLRSGEGPPSPHATQGASVAFGPRGVAPGVRVVHAFATPHWLTGGYLNSGSPDPPLDDGLRLFNHSWIGREGPGFSQVLRRVDWQIDQRDVVMCVGVNNGRGTRVPALLSSAYNVIAVGTAKNGGASSGGYTAVEVEGRCKPDIVGPRDLTSFTTPSVTACCAMLIERAHQMEDERAARSELIKAVLLAGAVKPEHWSSGEKPLDEHLGAGIVNVDRALRALDAGPVAGPETPRPFGWDMVQMQQGEARVLRFETARLWREATFVVVWNRRIDGRTGTLYGTNQEVWLDTPRLADVDLVLTRYDDEGVPSELAASRSRIDNVEHIYRRVLPPGRYRLQVVRRDDGFDEPWDVAIAWWMRLADDQNPSLEQATPSPD